jgi:hypothetical protein
MVARVLFLVFTGGGLRAHPPPPERPMGRPGEPLRRIVGATLAVALDANGRPPWVLAVARKPVVALGALWSSAVVRSRMKRRHNAFRIGPAIRRPIESDCFSLDQIIVFFSPAI